MGRVGGAGVPNSPGIAGDPRECPTGNAMATRRELVPVLGPSAVV